jgi:hypothetical protein
LLLIPNLDLKVDKITGKGLSTEDYTTAKKTKLASLSTTTNGADLTEYAKRFISINITTSLAANTFYFNYCKSCCAYS